MLKLKTQRVALHSVQELVALVQIAGHLCANSRSFLKNSIYSIPRLSINCGNHLKSVSSYVNKRHIVVAKKWRCQCFLFSQVRTRGSVHKWLLLIMQMWILCCVSWSVSAACYFVIHYICKYVHYMYPLYTGTVYLLKVRIFMNAALWLTNQKSVK